MQLVIHPPVEHERLQRIRAAAGSMTVINARDEAEALREMPEADAFFGKLTPPLLAAAKKLRWVQSPTASLEHYVFPALVDHPCQLTNMRGLYSDVIADHVLGYILCFARNLHVYLRQQVERRWEPVGGEVARTTFAAGPGTVSTIDASHVHLADCTLGIVGLGAIGSEIARRGLAFGMRVVAVDPVQTSSPPGVEALWRMDRLPELLAQSDFMVIAAPHTPETVKLFDAARIAQMKRTAYLINIGRGVIVDLKALVAALERGMIAGAALDVFETEPLPADHPLASPRIAQRHLSVLLENIGRFTGGEPLINVVNKAKWF
jgi:phosphoglycerate dehydrogenase-like enzyme